MQKTEGTHINQTISNTICSTNETTKCDERIIFEPFPEGHCQRLKYSIFRELTGGKGKAYQRFKKKNNH